MHLHTISRYYHPKNPTGSDFKSPGRGQVGYMGDGSLSPNGSGEGNLENGPKKPQVNLNPFTFFSPLFQYYPKRCDCKLQVRFLY